MPTLASIHVAKATRLPMRAVERATVETGRGIVGDRYHGTRHRHVTVQSASALHAATDAWLDACEVPEVRQVLLLDGPVVLGWEGFRDLVRDYGHGLTEQLLQAAIDAGQLPALPVTELTHVFLGALQEAAQVVLAEPSRRGATAQVLHQLLDGLTRTSSPA